MSEMMPETRDALSPRLRAISDTLDEWLIRLYRIRSSWTHPDVFFTWLEERGWTVMRISDRKRLEQAENVIQAQTKALVAAVMLVDTDFTTEPVFQEAAKARAKWVTLVPPEQTEAGKETGDGR